MAVAETVLRHKYSNPRNKLIGVAVITNTAELSKLGSQPNIILWRSWFTICASAMYMCVNQQVCAHCSHHIYDSTMCISYWLTSVTTVRIRTVSEMVEYLRHWKQIAPEANNLADIISSYSRIDQKKANWSNEQFYLVMILLSTWNTYR